VSEAAAEIAIGYARGPDDMEEIRRLFREYQVWLDVDLCFQGFEDELAALPGKYAEPAGCLLLARDGDAVAACVGMWPLEEGTCEMKRLYVRRAWRRRGLGRRLAEAIVAEGRARGYRRVRLDTLPQLVEAKKLYESMGFTEIPAYYRNPLDGVTYMELALDP
jgi:ribosomal protein S18 acetylase RimI-like enzyme